jgi:hypothetical protein
MQRCGTAGINLILRWHGVEIKSIEIQRWKTEEAQPQAENLNDT